MSVRREWPKPVGEQATAVIDFVLREGPDLTDPVIPASSISAMTLTIFEELSAAIVNSVADVDILNAGRGTVDSGGNVRITLDPLDNTILDATRRTERHVLFIEATYGGGKQAKFEIILTVLNFAKVP
jgi:hypothetical protein